MPAVRLPSHPRHLPRLGKAWFMVNVSLVLAAVAALLVLAVAAATFRYIPNDRVGLVEKLWSHTGSVTSGLIALKGEAGFQPELLRGGWHVLMPFQYRIHKMPLVTIPQGRIGYVFARDGQPLPATQALASNVAASDFQDVAGFLAAGGQRGPQRKILREGTCSRPSRWSPRRSWKWATSASSSRTRASSAWI
jgi:uncharacterized membrane protein YqiK